MSRVANICKQSKQRGNALVLLILLKTWQGEAPDHYELAELAHISPRQAERDLLKLVEDGEAERISPEGHGGRGCRTRWRVKQTTSDMSESDKTPSDVTEFKPQESPSDMTGIPKTTSDVTGLSDVNHDIRDGVSPQNPVTSDGTPFAPSKDLRTSTDKSLANARSPRARASDERDLTFSDYRAYAKTQSRLHAPDAWASTHFDRRDRDELVREWLNADSGEPPPAVSTELTPVELQEQVNVVAEMLKSGRTLPDIRNQLGAAIRPAQWQQIASTAEAQARVRPKPAEPPPKPAANVVPMARTHKIPAAG